MVENGNFVQGGGKGGFHGTVLVYGGIDPLTGQPYPDRRQSVARWTRPSCAALRPEAAQPFPDGRLHVPATKLRP